MFVGSWPRNHNTGRMFAHHAMGMFAEIAFSVVSIGLNYRHRNTKSKKMSQFLNFLPQNGLKITWYALSTDPKCTKSHLQPSKFQKFSRGRNPRTPPSKGAASRREGKGRRGGGGGEGRGSSGAFRGGAAVPPYWSEQFLHKNALFLTQ